MDNENKQYKKMIQECDNSINILTEKQKSQPQYQYKSTILVAEDEIFNYLFIEEVLSEKNITLIHAFNGSESVELFKKHPEINLVLMDIKMPLMNGYEAMKEIKKINPNMPVIVQSAYSMPNDIKKAQNAGCDGYLTKPIDSELLTNYIRKYTY